MITLTIFIIAWIRGAVEWNSDIALGVALFDLFMAAIIIPW